MEEVKKKFLLIFKKNRKEISASRGFILAIIPIVLTAAGLLATLISGQLSQAANDILSGIIAAIAAVLGGVGMILLNLSKELLNWVISPNFIGVSMTGMDNPVVAEGWTRIRDLANIFLILATIIIAIGIILGFEEYRAKKTLPVLIIIALLINFTPVICGFIIDFSNTLMKWVLGVGGVHPGFVDTVNKGLKELQKTDALQTLLASLAYVIFGFVGAIIYVLFALLFALRYIFLWILVVFSPIAFASRVFGPSERIKKFFPGFLHWDQWWNEFLTWNVIGIFAAFFIFLANALMAAMALPAQTISPLPTAENLAPMGSLFIYLLPLLLLLIGFFATLSTAQEAMTTAIPGMQAALKTAGKGAILAGKKVRETAPVKGAEEKIRRRMEGISETVGTERMKAGAKAKHQAAREKRIERNQAIVSSMGLDAAEKWVKTPEEKIALFKEKTAMKKLTDADVTPDKIRELKDYGISDKDSLAAAMRRPDVSRELIGMASKDLISRMSPEEIRTNVQAEGLRNPVSPDMFYALSKKQSREVMLKGSTAQKEALAETMFRNMPTILGEVATLRGTGRNEEADILENKIRLIETHWRT